MAHVSVQDVLAWWVNPAEDVPSWISPTCTFSTNNIPDLVSIDDPQIKQRLAWTSVRVRLKLDNESLAAAMVDFVDPITLLRQTGAVFMRFEAGLLVELHILSIVIGND